MEEWKVIEDSDGNYFVSSEGRIKGPRKMLKGKPDKDGYLEYAFMGADRVKKWRRGHRLVALAFIPNPDNLPIVNHKDENPANNKVSNLEWGTIYYNTTYSLSRKNKASLSAIGRDSLLLLISDYKTGNFTYKDLISKYNLSCGESDVGDVLRGRRHSELTGITEDIRVPFDHNKKIDDKDVWQIYIDYFINLKTQTYLVNFYKISPAQVSRILKGTRREKLYISFQEEVLQKQ